MATKTNAAMRELGSHIARTVRSLRQSRGWSLGSLAERAGLSKTNVATIESGEANPSMQTLLSLADALEVTLGTLLAVDRPTGTQVVRPGDTAFVRTGSGLQGRAIWSDGRNRRVEAHELRLEPGADYRSVPHPAGTEELIVCVEGSLRVGPDGDEVELDPRHAARFNADLPHRYRSEAGGTAVCIMSYPPAE